MNKHDDYLRILQATVKLQENIAAILEAKAYEAEKSRSWITRIVRSSHFASPEDLFKQSAQLHEAMLEVIDGITKMQLGLARNLKALLGRSDQDGGMGGGFQDFMDQNGGSL